VQPVASLPGVSRLSIDKLVETAREACTLGIPALALFPVIDNANKTEDGREATNPKNLVCRAVRALKSAVPDIGVICDVALDPYTTHGHDGLVIDGDVANDATVQVLVKQAMVLAEAGCDVVAPSDMMDGRVAAIRAELEKRGMVNVIILAYSAKYSSAFYGPFRDAVGSVGNLASKGKHSYQMDAANVEEAVREAAQDVAEGADMIIVKPGMPYLDVIAAVKREVNVPIAAYQVSGEYAMICFAAAAGAFDRLTAFQESLLAFKRAGASAVLTYAAMDIARSLAEKRGQ
jgi:porphobilinogen synthase